MAALEYGRFTPNLRPIEEVYPHDDVAWGNSFQVYDYRPLIDSLGFEVVVYEVTGQWQGDIFVLLKDEQSGWYGLSIIGYGSCSGCDALQACSSYEQVDALRQDILSRIQWGTVDDVFAYLTDRDHETQFYWGDSEGMAAINEMVKHLKAEMLRC